MRYRIRIDVLRSGTKEYTPQVKVGFFSWWENLIRDEHNDFYIASTKRLIYFNEKDPLDMIESHKKHIKEKGLSKLKKTYYKKVKYMSKKIYISSRGTGKVDKDGKITDYTLLSYDLVTPPKRTLFRRIFDFFKKLWNFIKPKQR